MIALIMPVYNTEKYLEEAIESIINQTLSFKENISLVHIVLETGRTHQIRAQFSNIGHPLVGDGKYGSRINGDIALCSFRLSFIHPLTKEKLCFSILPEMKQKWKLFEKELAFFGIES